MNLSEIEFIFKLNFIFKTLLLIVVIISFFIFINILVLKNQNYKSMFSTWQFPMLLALYLDVIYGL
jgi:uncharacterized integral membrane protein